MVLNHMIQDCNLGAKSHRNTVLQPQVLQNLTSYVWEYLAFCLESLAETNDLALTLYRSQWVAAVSLLFSSQL